MISYWLCSKEFPICPILYFVNKLLSIVRQIAGQIDLIFGGWPRLGTPQAW